MLRNSVNQLPYSECLCAYFMNPIVVTFCYVLYMYFIFYINMCKIKILNVKYMYINVL
jgi:hypothetical protein